MIAKQLKELLKNIPDDAEVLVPGRGNFEYETIGDNQVFFFHRGDEMSGCLRGLETAPIFAIGGDGAA